MGKSEDIFGEINLEEMDDFFDNIIDNYNEGLDFSEEEAFEDFQEPDYDAINNQLKDTLGKMKGFQESDHKETDKNSKSKKEEKISATVITSVDEEAVKQARAEERKKKAGEKKKKPAPSPTSNDNGSDSLNFTTKNTKESKEESSIKKQGKEPSTSDEMFDNISRTDYGDKNYIKEIKSDIPNASSKPKKKPVEAPNKPSFAPNNIKEPVNKPMPKKEPKKDIEEEIVSGEVEDDFIFVVPVQDDTPSEEIEIESPVTISSVDEPKAVNNTSRSVAEKTNRGVSGDTEKNNIFTSKNINNEVRKPVKTPVNSGKESIKKPINENRQADTGLNNNGIFTYKNANNMETPVANSPATTPHEAVQDNENSYSEEYYGNAYQSNTDYQETYSEERFGETAEDNTEDIEGNIEEGTTTLPFYKSMRFKKACVVAIALFIMIIFPVSLTLMFGKKSNNDKKQIKATTTENSFEFTYSESDNSSAFQEAGDYAYQSLEENASSGRFETLDDLTLYLSGQSMSCLSAEKQAERQYKNYEITYDDLKTIVDYNSGIANELYHLLIVNKNVYTDEGQEDVYNELLENINTLIVYGDTLLINASR